MSRRFLMTWQPDRRRWRKMYKGRLYFVTCEQLGTTHSKEASYQAANAWWRTTLASLDTAPPTPVHPAVEEMFRRVDWLRRHGYDATTLQVLAETVEDVAKEDGGAMASHIAWSAEPATAAVWNERFEAETRSKTASEPAEKSIGDHLEQYLANEKARVDADSLSPSEYGLARLCLDHFVSCVGTSSSPKTITADKWEGYWRLLLDEIASHGKSREYQRKRLRHARSFVAWMATRGALTQPPNLRDRRHGFGGEERRILSCTAEQARSIVDRATGQLRLHLLLMLNCGFTQVDVSDLHPSEVVGDRIVRKRSKTRRKRSTPTVSYLLWPETVRLLQEHRSDDPDHVLLTQRGRPWVEESVVRGRRYRRDGIHTLYRELESPVPIKTFRATSATLLDSSRDHGRMSQYFLGHGGATVAERHYLDRGSEGWTRLLDDAVTWLGGQYGFA